ncbi:MAG: ABC transporter ATP-binding protein [Eggerthellaceae bacterium]|jgi:ABC-2 type transport system ATP-binding protein
MTNETQSSPEPIIELNHVHMAFNIANEKLTNLKEYFIKILKHELFYREFVALDDVNLNIYPGERYGFIGVNGSGKSTLLKIIAGVLEPTTGTCITHGSIAPIIELGAGFDMELTGRENIYLNGALLGYSRQFIDEHMDEIVEFAEVEKFVDMPLKNYSSGMVTRIAFSIATATIPDILVVDEALSVGDINFQAKCEARIHELVEENGTTLLFVSHSIDQVERVCNRALWLDHGVMRQVGDVRPVCDAYLAEQEQKKAEELAAMESADAAATEAKETEAE